MQHEVKNIWTSKNRKIFLVTSILAYLCIVSSSTLNPFIPKSHYNILHIRGGSSGGSRSNIFPSSSTATTTTTISPSRYQNIFNRSSKQQEQQKLQEYEGGYSTAIEEHNKDDDQQALGKEVINSFLSRENRNSFIIKVYSILTVQLLVTSLFIFGFHSFKGLSYWMLTKGRMVPFLSLFMSSICCTIMTTSTKARRTSPTKWQLLSLFTLGQSIAVGFITSFHPLRTVVSAMLATALATGGVTLYTFWQQNPKYDLSQWGAALSSLGLIFIFYGMIHLLSIIGIIPQGFIPYNESIFCMLGATLFSFYLAYHTRLIFSGKYNTKYQLDENDYVFGAMTLYSDIINIFIYILRIMADNDDSR